MKEVNLEYGRTTLVESMKELNQSIKLTKSTRTMGFMFIHGYGSFETGGAICKSARQWLKAQERNGKLKSVIFGENFDIFNSDAR